MGHPGLRRGNAVDTRDKAPGVRAASVPIDAWALPVGSSMWVLDT
jgi:hypothetical protein